MKAGKIIRIVCLVLIAGVFGFGIYSANKKTPLSEKVWDERTTVGSMDAENYFIIYTDLVCPYCIAFENAILENEEEFKEYIEMWIHEIKVAISGLSIINYSMKEICDKYINITKITRNENTNEFMFFIWAVFLKLLYPYIPNIVSEIQNKFDIDWQWLTIQDLKDIELSGKNYKINIFTEVIDKINSLKDQLGIKKHEFVDIVVQANPDLLSFLQENESIFRLLTKIQHMSLIRPHEEMPIWYKVDNVINISVWIRKPENVSIEIKKDVLAELEWEYREKIEHLQHLKSLFASIYWNADSELMEKKRQEISNLQNDIEDLEFKIWKLKMNN